MSQIGMLNNPSLAVAAEFKEFVNNESSTALTHGMVVCVDTTSMATKSAAGTVIGELGIIPTAANQVNVLGIVFDPGGFTVPAGQRGVVMTRGIHPSVKVDGTTDISIGDQLGTKDSGAVCIKGTPVVTGVVGTALAAYTGNNANGTIACFVDVK